MAGIKIHQYPLERLTFGDDDYYDIDYWDGAAYQTAKIKGSTIKDAIRSGILTIYSDNGSLTENRTIDIAGFNLAFTGGSIGMGDDLTVVSTDAAKPFVGNFINSNGDAVLYVANTGDNVGIGTSAPESDAKLDIESTSKGILIPRMTTTERGSITLATFNESMIIYNTTTNQFEYIDSTLNWVPFGGGAEALDDLTDVTTGLPVTPTEADDGRLLFYDYDSAEWITDETVTHGTVVINCKKSTAGTIAKGLPVYLVGFDADLHTVELANASSTNTMPVIGFTAEPLNDTDSKHLTTFGKLTGIDTTSTVSTLNPNGETWLVNDALYMSTTTGGLTKVRPTGGTTQIQRIAKVLKVDATGGQIFVFNTARTAGLPNLGVDKLWIGDANGIPQEVDKSTIGASIYTADDTIGSGRVATLTDSLTFDGGTVKVQGANTLLTSTAFEIYDNDTTPTKLWDFRNNGDVYLGKDSVYYLQSNDLTISTLSGSTTPINYEFGTGFGGYYSRWDNNGALTIKSGTTSLAFRVLSKVNAAETMFRVGNEGGGFMSTNGARLWTISDSTTSTTKNEFDENRFSQYWGGSEYHRIQTSGGGTGVSFFRSGISGSLGYFIVGSSSRVGSEEISFQGDTLIDGTLDMNNNRILNTIVNPTVQETTSAATFTINATNENTGVLTAQAAALTVANPTGTIVQGQKLVYRIKDNGTARAITWGANFRAIGVTLPTTTTASKLIYVGCIYNSTDSKWDVIAVNEEA